MVRIIVCGSRTFRPCKAASRALDEVISQIRKEKGDTDIEIVSGHARGADQYGEQYAKTHNLRTIVFPAQWGVYGKSAGYRRNETMLDYARKETALVVAFWDGQSRGTKHMIDIARKANVAVHIAACE